MGSGSCAHLMAQPKECRQVGDMVGMQMTDGDQREIAHFGLGLAEAQIGPATHVDEHFGLAADPKQIAR